MKKTLTALLMGSILLCAGCDGSSQKLNDAIAQAQRAPDAWQGSQQLKKEAEELDVPTFANLLAVPVMKGKTYQDAYFELFKKALAQERVPALIDLFSEPNLSDLKQQYVGVLVSRADASTGGRQDASLLSAAGALFAQGNWVVTDNGRAAGYYARAWQAGDARAPLQLYKLFVAQRDYPSAYLWGIRCIGDCYYGTNQELTSEARINLTPAQIVMMQRLAKDRRVITVNGLGAKEE